MSSIKHELKETKDNPHNLKILVTWSTRKVVFSLGKFDNLKSKKSRSSEKTAHPKFSKLKMQAVFTWKNKGFTLKFRQSYTTLRDGKTCPGKSCSQLHSHWRQMPAKLWKTLSRGCRSPCGSLCKQSFPNGRRIHSQYFPFLIYNSSCLIRSLSSLARTSLIFMCFEHNCSVIYASCIPPVHWWKQW